MVILFDLDDTLVDHSTALRAATETLHKSVDSSLPLERFSVAWTASHRKNFDLYLAGALSYDAQRRARVRETIDPTLSDEAADQVFATYLAGYEAAWSLFSDVQGRASQATYRDLRGMWICQAQSGDLSVRR